MKYSRAAKFLGLIGLVAFIALYARSPSWPTPDKLFLLLLFIFMLIGQARAFVGKFGPFVALLLAYESFRGMADQLNTRVEYVWMITVDRWIGGGALPTIWLQDRLYAGSARWFDFALYFVYMLHFILPFALAIAIWKLRPAMYWRYVATFISVSFAGFITFLLFPAAPPWLASQEGYLPYIARVSSDVWFRLGIEDFPSIYNVISPNPVAAVPSLHAAYATIFALFVFRVFGRRWGFVSLIYPACIYFGTVYQGEHYVIDELIGGLYAIVGYVFISLVWKKFFTPTNSEIRRKKRADNIASDTTIGVSFSVIACREYAVDWEDCLKDTIRIGYRRFRIMSYWSLHETSTDGGYNFDLLDKQLDILESSGCSATVCLGMRQPRWPETHAPDWAADLSIDEREKRYLQFHQAVIERYKSRKCIESWQLENEFWLRSFGLGGNFSRERLKREFHSIRQLDPERPIIMSLAHVVSLPIREPTPDLYATSIYRVTYDYKTGDYSFTWTRPIVFAIKRFMIQILKNRELVIHELQTEPWGPKANWEMSIAEQNKSISPSEIKAAVEFAQKTGINYIDVWGAEWWYWRKTVKKDDRPRSVAAEIASKANA